MEIISYNKLVLLIFGLLLIFVKSEKLLLFTFKYSPDF